MWILVGIAILVFLVLWSETKDDKIENLKPDTYLDEYKEWEDEEAKKIKKFYKKYIKSNKWNQKRLQRFELDGYRCTKCGSTNNLTCHHIIYKNLGDEKINDIVSLCWECHSKLHEEVGYPETYACYKVRKFI